VNPTDRARRKPLIAGNWKMFHGGPTGVVLASECVKIAREVPRVEIVIAPPYTALAACAAECHESPVAIAAQNVHAKDQGAFTGEISAAMLKDAGCTWVIIGHSERRQHFGESDGMVAEKLDSALRAGLKPIVCVGETLAQREAGDTLRVVRLQVDAVSPLLAAASVPLAIAYEPVWAIGTGKNASPADAEEVHLAIRGWLAERSAKLAAEVRILYGGSVKPDNAASLLACPNVDGALIGGASLDAGSFGAIARAAEQDVARR
jgi:triosephosphate isomerase (TIM)